MGGLIELAAASVDVQPGGRADLGVLVFNTGDDRGVFEVLVTGEMVKWAHVAPAKLVIDPGQLVLTTLILMPPKDPLLPAGPMPFSLQLHCLTDPGPPEVADGQILIFPFEDHLLTITPPLADTAMGTKVRLHAQNNGNTPVMLLLEAVSPDGALLLDLPETMITVRPGDTATTTLEIEPVEQHLVGRVRNHDYGVQALSVSGVASIVQARVRQRPTLGAWSGRLFAVLVAVAVTAAVLITSVVSSRHGDHKSAADPPNGHPELALDPRVPSFPGGAAAPGTGATVKGGGPAASPGISSGPPSGGVVGLTDSAGLPLAIPTPAPGAPPAVTTGPGTPGLVALHRLYDPALGDYLYMSTQPEVDAAKAAGLVDQGVMGRVYTGAVPGSAPLYRLTGADGRDLFTSVSGEIDVATQQGYRNDGLVGYLYTSPVGGSLAVFRLSIGGQRCLTTSPDEQRKRLAAGWHDDGLEGYVLA